MTNEAPNHVTAEVDQAQPKKTKDGVRFLVTLGFPFKQNKAIAMMLIEQIGNPLDIDFTLIQATLPESTSKTVTGPAQDIRYAEHKTTVDGVEAVVMLPVTDGGRRNKINPHPFKADPEDASKCLWCKHGEAYQAHDAARIEAAAQEEIAKLKASGAKSNGHRANPTELAAQGEETLQRMHEAYQTPHAFEPRTQDDCCDACGHLGADAVHVPAVEVESIPEHLRAEGDEALTGNAAADALIGAAAETEAVPSA